eukprot:TRINITY_DN2855_c0_g1_i1.p1 TRINITY_DN2855_c0_g1~~TRINITY_DN2855_c0_g1_i1.p1  ORF type:complete len:485 (-),score=87.86 TRINITY_DN2855_c0_g1_i1:245-1699(-)
MAKGLQFYLACFSFRLLCLAAASKEYEWAGIFETPKSNYLWTAQKKAGKYADPAMKLVALPASASTEAELKKLEAAGNAAMKLTCTALTAGSTIVPATNKCYSLKFDQTAWQSLYKVDAGSVTSVAFFAEHFPTEFEATAHYLKDDVGTDVEPQAKLPDTHATHKEEEHKEKHEGAAIGSSILVNLMTLSGIIFLVPFISTVAASKHKLIFNGVLFAFSAGALLSCAFFLLLFEATHLVAAGWKEEVEQIWRWGTMILAGMIIPSTIESAVTAILAGRGGQTKATAETIDVAEKQSKEEEAVSEETATSDWRTRSRLIGSVLIGDFFHNLSDGFFIGAAFKGCGSSFGWGVAGASILHEIPQELADFVVLTSPEAGLSKILALGLNFLSGCSVLLGTIIVLYSDISNSAIGLILAFGGGVYIHIGAVDCMPKMYNSKFNLVQRVSCLFAFILGAILIGLILLDHEHCVPASTEGGGGGHAHHHH